MAPTFAFIDPFGFKGVPIQLVGRLLAFDRCEVFFHFMYNRVNQFLAAERITPHLNGLFGTRDYIQACDLDPGARKRFLHDLYKRQLHDVGGFTSETTGGDGRASLTESVAYRRLLPPEALRQLKPRRALLVYGHLPPVRIRLRPWFRSRRLVTLAMAVDAAVPHPAMAVDDLPRSRCCGRATRRRPPPDATPHSC